MLMNWTDTLDDVFTLAHEMGHSMHTMLSHERQPFVYSDYTIFVAEVPSTLSEALLLEHLLARATDRNEQIVLLQHAIDNITSTFYTQVMFADFELRGARAGRARRAHHGRRVERAVQGTVRRLLRRRGRHRDLTPITWARIPHFFNSPYYVYQYATCFASAARLAREITTGPAGRWRGRASPVSRLARRPAAATTP